MPARKRFLYLLSLIACCVISSAASVHAEDIEQEAQNWDMVTLRVDLPHKLMLYGEVQPRVGLEDREHSGMDRILLRPAIGYQITPNVSIWQGYAWTPGFRPKLHHENRLYQQLLVENRIKKLTLTNRIRLEERFIAEAGGTSLRARHMTRAQYPIARSKKWSLVAYDELFVNLNDTRSSPVSGFDQNRAFAGVNRKFNEHINAEAGYMMNYVNRQNTADKINHILLLGINVIVK